jgi:hypothetical protein
MKKQWRAFQVCREVCFVKTTTSKKDWVQSQLQSQLHGQLLAKALTAKKPPARAMLKQKIAQPHNTEKQG